MSSPIERSPAWSPGIGWIVAVTIGFVVLGTPIVGYAWDVLSDVFTGRGLWGRRVALASSWTYTVGVLIFVRGMISTGLTRMPRRTFMAGATYTPHFVSPEFTGF